MKQKKLLVALSMAGLTTFLSGCDSTRKTEPTAMLDTSASAFVESVNEDALAVVNGKTVLKTEDMKAMNDIINLEIVSQYAVTKKIDVSKQDAQLEHVKRKLYAQAYIEDFISQQEVTDAEIAKKYETLKERTDLREFNFKIAQFDKREDATNAYENLASEKPDKSILKPFVNAKGQSVEWSAISQLPPMLASALSNLEKGEASKVLSTNKGYFLVYLEGKREKKMPPLEELETQIKQALIQEKVFSHVSELRSKSTIMIN